jgi:hypothetical protein
MRASGIEEPPPREIYSEAGFRIQPHVYIVQQWRG